MNWSTIGFLFLATFTWLEPANATAGYLGSTFSEYDMLGCHNNSQNPRCKKVIPVACKSICYGHENEQSPFGKACKELCALPLKNDKTQNNEPKTRHQ